MEFFWEVMKATLPAFVVFLTVYVFLNAYFEKNILLEKIKNKGESNLNTLKLKLQAYERLTLLCERLNLSNLLLRVQSPNMTVAELKYALLISSQQEFEHNFSQQIYVSNDLWQIIKMARDYSVNLVIKAAEELDPKGDAQLLSNKILAYEEQTQSSAWDKALQGLKQEVSTLF